MSNYVTDTMKFNDELKPGDIGMARWTANFNYYSAKAEVIKVNKSSIRVKLVECSQKGIYAPGEELVLPRCAFGCIQRWSRSNGFFSLETIAAGSSD